MAGDAVNATEFPVCLHFLLGDTTHLDACLFVGHIAPGTDSNTYICTFPSLFLTYEERKSNKKNPKKFVPSIANRSIPQAAVVRAFRALWFATIWHSVRTIPKHFIMMLMIWVRPRRRSIIYVQFIIIAAAVERRRLINVYWSNACWVFERRRSSFVWRRRWCELSRVCVNACLPNFILV